MRDGKVECPHCQKLIDGPDEEIFYDEDEFEMRCDDCDKYFDVYAEVSITFRAERKDDNAKAKNNEA